MPVYLLSDQVIFPPVDHAEDGLLAVGGDLSPKRLLHAYTQGIFPWYSEGEPILWHSPDPRFVLRAEALHVPRKLRPVLRNRLFDLTMDSAFDDVIEACARTRRRGQKGTWITPEMKAAYRELHRLGFAHSVEAWKDGVLAGGLYGVSLGGAYFGESMFASADDASKVAFVALVRQLERWDITLIDSQIYTPHIARFGAELWPREDYLEALELALRRQTRMGPWRFDAEEEACE